jgi:hypothetical protein
MRFFTGLKFYDPKWMSLVRQGSQLAVIGVILACTPRLQTLELMNYSRRRLREGQYENHHVLEPDHLAFSDMFGNLGKASTFSIAWIPGLANLGSLSSNCLLSSHLITLPNQTRLKFDLQNEQHNDLPLGIRLPQSIHTSASKLRRLEVKLDVESLCESWAGSDADVDDNDLKVYS